MEERCMNCGGPVVVVKGDHRFIESGLTSVTLKGVDLIKCEECNSSDPVIPRMNELMRLIVLALIWKPCKLRGEDVRYLRKYLGLSAVDFSDILAIDPTTLSKWENDHDPVGPANDRLIRLVTLAMADDQLQKLHNDVEKLVKQGFRDIDSSCDYRLMDIDSETMSYAYA